MDKPRPKSYEQIREESRKELDKLFSKSGVSDEEGLAEKTKTPGSGRRMIKMEGRRNVPGSNREIEVIEK